MKQVTDFHVSQLSILNVVTILSKEFNRGVIDSIKKYHYFHGEPLHKSQVF